MSAYQKEYLWAQENPQQFWKAQAEQLDWFEQPKTILQRMKTVLNVGSLMVCLTLVGLHSITTVNKEEGRQQH